MTKKENFILDGPRELYPFSPVCALCALFNFETESCLAFDEIPDEIWTGKNNHTKRYPGDKGIRFKKREVTNGSTD